MFVSFLRRHVTKKGVYSPQTQGRGGACRFAEEEHVGIRVLLQNQKRLGSYDSFFFLCAAAWHSHSDRSTAVHATTHSHSRQNCTSTGSMLNLRGCGRHVCKYGWHGQRGRERVSSPHIRAHIPHFSLRATGHVRKKHSVGGGVPWWKVAFHLKAR
jgi:hypothetical protein